MDGFGNIDNVNLTNLSDVVEPRRHPLEAVCNSPPKPCGFPSHLPIEVPQTTLKSSKLWDVPSVPPSVGKTGVGPASSKFNVRKLHMWLAEEYYRLEADNARLQMECDWFRRGASNAHVDESTIWSNKKQAVAEDGLMEETTASTHDMGSLFTIDADMESPGHAAAGKTPQGATFHQIGRGGFAGDANRSLRVLHVPNVKSSKQPKEIPHADGYDEFHNNDGYGTNSSGNFSGYGSYSTVETHLRESMDKDSDEDLHGSILASTNMGHFREHNHDSYIDMLAAKKASPQKEQHSPRSPKVRKKTAFAAHLSEEHSDSTEGQVATKSGKKKMAGADEGNTDKQTIQELIQSGRMSVRNVMLLEQHTGSSDCTGVAFGISPNGGHLTIRQRLQRVIEWHAFDIFVGVIIIIDGALLGVEAESGLQQGGAPGLLIATSLLIKVIFTVELFLRLYAYGPITALRMSNWTKFDTLLVLLALVETYFLVYVQLAAKADDNGSDITEGNSALGSMTVLRIFRLARLARAARLVVQFRTLWLLLSGLKASAMTIVWTCLLIASISYIFAVFGMETIPPRAVPDENSEYDRKSSYYFGNLPNSMLTLLQVLTFDSIGQVYRPLIIDAPGPAAVVSNLIFFMLYILIVSIALMNLVTAVMVEGSLKQANEDKEALRIFEEQRKKVLMPKLKTMFDALDEDQSGEVTWDELDAAPEELKQQLMAISNTDNLKEVFQLLDDDDGGSIQVDEFLDGILKASSGDVILKLQIDRLVRQIGKMKDWIRHLVDLQLSSQGLQNYDPDSDELPRALTAPPGAL